MTSRLRRLNAVAHKEFLHVLRDPRSLALGIITPLIMLFLFGYALTLDVDQVPLVVWDQSNSPQSRELLSNFEGSRYFDLKHYLASYKELERAIDRREALAALVIPVDFANKLDSRHKGSVQLLLDGSDPNTATIAQSYADAIIMGWSQKLLVEQLLINSGAANLQKITTPRLEIRARVWFNSDLVSRHFIFPGLIPVIMMIVAALLTALSMAREWETGTMEQLIAMPVGKAELIIGKLAPYFCIGIIDLILSVAVGNLVFGVPLRGSIWLLVALSLLFLLGSLAVGMLISIITKSQLLASQLALVITVLPAFLLSGFIFPLENMPAPIQTISHVVVARYFVTILRGIYLKDVGLAVLWPHALFLLGFAFIVLGASMLAFRKRLE